MSNIIVMREKYINHKEYLNMKTKRIDLKIRLLCYINNLLFCRKKLKEKIKIGNKYLDNYQKKAVFIDEDNVLVFAGAGSGKTLTIEAKIDYLVNTLKISEKEILCLSFTNDSVNDLKNRIKYDIDIFTFHKLALELLNDYNKTGLVEPNYLSYIINEIFLSITNNIDEKTLNYFNNEISNFINLLKTNNISIKYLNKLIRKNKKNKLLLIIKKIYLIYDLELNSSDLIDFNDMINKATIVVNNCGLKRYYKYIIIDEYQDISLNRLNLVKAIKESCNSKLFVVGDDYQSIYKFAGSNLNMILNFKKYFGYYKIIKLRNIYRNSNELIKVSSDFIMKNKKQIKKKLISSKHLNRPVVIIYYKKNLVIKFKKLLDEIDGNTLILGRNKKDIDMLNDEEIFIDNNIITYKEKEYKYKTVHKSKGLEEDNVILINLKNGINGFPNKNKDSISNLLLEKEKMLYEEERRLFYVALTRTKNYVYLFVPKDNPSLFVKEIIRKNRKYIEEKDL